MFVLGSVGLSFRSYASGVVRPILGGLAMVGVGILVTSSFTVDFWVLAVGGTASLGAYALVLLPGESGLLRWRTRRNEAHRLAVSN